MKKDTLIKLLDGTQIPQMGFGTWQLDDEKDIEVALNGMYEAGYRHIDTAQIYNNEYQIGNFLNKEQSSHDDIYLTTKVWISNFMSKDDFIKSVHQSLARLGVKKVNLLLLHWAVSEEISNKAYQWLEEVKAMGLTDSIGVSNFSIKRLESLLKIAKHKPVVNQIQFDLVNQQEKLIAYCKDHDIKIEGYSLLKPYLGSSSRSSLTEEDKKVVDAIGAKYQKSGPQIILRYALEKGLIIFPKSKNPKRIMANIDLYDFSLNDEDRQALASMSKVLPQKMDSVAEEGDFDYMLTKSLLYKYNFKDGEFGKEWDPQEDDSKKGSRIL